MGREVALKVLPADADPERRRRFLLEAEALARVTHPNVVKLHDAGEQPPSDAAAGFLWIAMERLEGRTLAEALAQDGPMDVPRALRVAHEVARALREAHAVGVIHRDLKPANLFLVRGDDGEGVRVLDFGVAKVRAQGGEQLTAAGALVGSPRYTSPEQLGEDEIDGRADLYALGIVIHEMLAGAPPFAHGEAMRTLLAQLRDAPPPLRALRPDVPEGLEALVLALLAKKPEERPPDAHSLLARLAALREDPSAPMDAPPPAPPVPVAPTPAAAPVVAVPPRSAGGGVRETLRGAGLALLALAAGLGVAIALFAWRTPRAEETPDAPVAAAGNETRVESTPPGATVWQGRTKLGVTPLSLPPGARILRLSRSGYRDAQVAVAAGERRVEVMLEAAPRARSARGAGAAGASSPPTDPTPPQPQAGGGP
jgi:hypothetical protein